MSQARAYESTNVGALIDQGHANLRTGPFGTQLKASEYGEEGVPVLNVRNLGFGSLRPADIEHAPQQVQERLNYHLLRAGDIVFGRKGAVDRHVLISDDQDGWMQGSDCIRLRLESDAPVLAEYLSKMLVTDSHKMWMEAQCSHGATMASLNQDIIRRIVLDLPPMRQQRRVVAVLTSFDELIEVNERRIELLDDLARSLYREWFVHFRFPGHEEVKMAESELGRIPAGWEVRAAGEVFDVLGGGTPSKKRVDYWNGGLIPWFTPTDLTRAQRRFAVHSSAGITDLGLKKSAARLFPPGSVLMTSRATLGELAIAAVSGTCNQGFIVITPEPGIPSEFVYEWLRSKASELEQIATGATFKEITKGAFKRFPVMVPEPRVLKEFASSVLPFSQMIMKLEALNSRFAATRDLLLPRLVSGKLDISDIDLGVLAPAETE